jgi:hypothetical protein
VFVFYFAGRGTQIKDVSGDEEDGLDEAFVLVNGSGQVTSDTLMLDDDFSDAIYGACHDDNTIRILILTDCGFDIADLSGGKWHGRKAISIAAFGGSDNADGSIIGGLFTQAMLLGVDRIGSLGIYHTRDKVGHLGLDNLYSVGMLYNASLIENAAVFASKQQVTIQCTKNATADKMPWPFVAPAGYEAPLRRQALGNPVYESDEPERAADEPKAGRDCSSNALFTGCARPCQAPAPTSGAQTGVARISPAVIQNANMKNVLRPDDPSYLQMIQGTDLMLKVSRSCHSDKCVLS